MSTRTRTERLQSGTSVLAISALALIGASAIEPAFAASNAYTKGLFGGGSTLASLSLRQVFDCYMHSTIGVTTITSEPGSADGYKFTPGFKVGANPTPGYLPSSTIAGNLSCANVSKAVSVTLGVEGLYAGVGSGGGLRGFLANTPVELFGGSPPATPGLPALSPPYLDGNSTKTPFQSYPYPRLDFGAGDSPLKSTVASLSTTTYTISPATWAGTSTTTSISGLSAATVSYSVGSLGQPIQLPLFEAVVDVSVNLPTVSSSTTTVNGVTWTINSQLAKPTQPGEVIQLSTAQICAIFSDLVTNWNSTASIPAISKTGTSLPNEVFYSSNTNYEVPATTYIPGTSSVAINVVYRSDGSGTSFIFTNYLANVCPQLDTADASSYVAIFSSNPVLTQGDPNYTTASTFAASLPLPSTSFGNLISRIKAIKGSSATSNWIGASGSAAVSSAIGNTANSPTTQIGNIGYLSNDFNSPYNPATTAPESASVQDEFLRLKGVYHPGDTKKNFAEPTPTNAQTAWAGLVLPSTTATYASWNPYAQTFTTGTQGGVSLAGLSILPMYDGTDAYPLSGTTFLYLYSCYGTGTDGTSGANRVSYLTNYLAWFLASADSTDYTTAYSDTSSNRDNPGYDASVVDVIKNNGFNGLPAKWAHNLILEYVNDTNSTAIASIDTATNGCSGVTGGAQ